MYAVPDVEPHVREKWETWLEDDKFPDVVFEITSKSTIAEDLGHKVRLYGRLGAREYYIYDPAQVVQPPLRAYRRVGGRLAVVPLQADLAVYSEALEAELRVVGEWLRLIDPATDEPYPTPEEEHQGRLAAEIQARQEAEARQMAEEARRAAEIQAQQEAQARQRAEAQAQQEADARRTAEEALQAALAELARLRDHPQED